MQSQSNWFVVTSHGWSASHWLAYSLNSHSDITCAHSSAAILAESPEPFDVTEQLKGRRLDEIYPRLRELRDGYAARAVRSPDALCSALEQRHPARLVGSVHTFRLRDLPGFADRIAAAGRPIRVANLLRDPVSLVNSGYGQFRLSLRLDLNEAAWTLKRIVAAGLEPIEDICARHGVFPGDFEPLCFLAACVALRGLAEDFAARDEIIGLDGVTYLGTIRMEDVTRHPACLAAWIERLDGRPWQVAPGYLEAVYGGGPTNGHRAVPGPLDADGIAASWTAWQREIFAFYLKRFSLIAPYRAEGYELSRFRE